MKAEAPALGILKMNEWGHSKMYKIDCSCHNDSCSHVIDIEADSMDVTVTIYATPKTKWWSMNRWKQIWTLLTKGYLEYETCICLDKQVALNYAETLKSAVADVEAFQAEKKSLKDIHNTVIAKLSENAKKV